MVNLEGRPDDLMRAFQETWQALHDFLIAYEDAVYLREWIADRDEGELGRVFSVLDQAKERAEAVLRRWQPDG